MMEMHWIPDNQGRLTIVWRPAQVRETDWNVAVATPKTAVVREVVAAISERETQRAA